MTTSRRARGARRLPRRRRSSTARATRAVHALDGVALEIRPGETRRAARPLRLGQDDAAARARRPRRADRAASVEWHGRPLVVARPRRARRGPRARASPTSSRARTCCPTSRRSRTSPSPRTLRGGDADPALAPDALLELVGLGGEGRPPARRALRRRGAARRDRARARAAAGAAAVRRADRPPRLRHRRARARPDRRAAGASSASRSWSRPTTPTSPRGSTRELELDDGRVVREERAA